MISETGAAVQVAQTGACGQSAWLQMLSGCVARLWLPGASNYSTKAWSYTYVHTHCYEVRSCNVDTAFMLLICICRTFIALLYCRLKWAHGDEDLYTVPSDYCHLSPVFRHMEIWTYIIIHSEVSQLQPLAIDHVVGHNHWLHIFSTDTDTLATRRVMKRVRVPVWGLLDLALIAGLLPECYSAGGERVWNWRHSANTSHCQHWTYKLFSLRPYMYAVPSYCLGKLVCI